MITCLDGYFGLKNVVTGTRYINELPGFRSSTLDDIKDDEDTIEEAWETIHDRALRNYEQDLTNKLKKYFKRYQIIDSTVTSNVETNEILSNSDEYIGWMFDVVSWSKNTKIVIEQVNFFLPSAQNGSIYVYDATIGTRLFEKSFTGVEGINTVFIDQEFATYKYTRLFVCYDASQITPYKTNDYGFGVFNFYRKKVSKSSAVIKSNMSESDSGLIISYNIKCSIDNFVCQRMSIFIQPLLYKLGIEFLRECRDSLEMNRHTLLDTEQREAQITDFQEQYDMMLENTMKDMVVKESDDCFVCNKAISKRIMLP